MLMPFWAVILESERLSGTLDPPWKSGSCLLLIRYRAAHPAVGRIVVDALHNIAAAVVLFDET
jgi:hypothetical protein